ncbi:MAG: lipid-A-disaccharide synthase [Candidatus Omnitrophica bacterium]|nr:lipid-A-disaccharide synthase [Candidatus Omnitrophota bacterium]
MDILSSHTPLEPTPKHLMIVAGEVSGDNHGAALVKALQQLHPALTFSGLGGPKMQAAGVDTDEDLTRFAVVGFFEIIKHYREFHRCFESFLHNVSQRKPAAVILVDYPGFNLRLAARLKKMGVPVIYYISPQVWAWKENRVNFIKKNVDLMMVLFDFEKKFYADRGVEVDFVGHPLADEIQITSTREETLTKAGLSADKFTIGLLPGSRQKEIESLLPPMLDAAKIMHTQDPRFQFLILKASNLAPELFKNFLTQKSFPLKLIDGHFHDGLNACDICMVASGTATLETALLLKPMVIVYKTSFLTFTLAKALIKIPYIGLVNVVAGKKIVPECIQDNANGSAIAAELKKIYQNPSEFDTMCANLEKVKISLGASGASKRAAESILRFLQHTS